MRWTLKPQPDTIKVKQLAKELSIDTTLAKILVQRGIETFDEAKHFFRPSLSDLHNPFLMKDMEIAVQRIETAIANNENILVFGDYDVDGTTAVSLMSSYLKTIHPNIATYIPDRYEEGYGVSFQGIDFAEDNGFSLIIALDCGIKAIDKVAYATEKNIDFIICDHHKPGSEVPKAVAVLNPKQVDCSYPYDELCGCGVGFKLIQALASKRNQTTEDLIPYLDLVATAIAADIVPMTGENRVLAYHGLQVINSQPRNGIKAIIHQLQKKELTITDVVFIIAPRINAAGRMKHGNYAVELLTEMDFDSAIEFASAIEKFNSDRKELDRAITQEALLQIENNNEQEKYTTVVFDENWHKGVIGIVASRLTETYYRPTLVFTKSGDKLAASARSVKGFDVYNALEACSEFIEQFGGHKYAAGLTLLPEQYENFKNKFEEVVSATIEKSLLTPEITIDAEIDLSEITPKFFRIIQQMAPFGPLNMKPVFTTTAVRDNGYGKQVGADSSHLKLNLIYGSDQKTYNAIGFGLGNKISTIQNDFDIAYTLDENTWNGYTSIQLMLKDLK
ncbi:single-stranded-DNA-specific exonuclease RecJ [Tenacibaculum discolor]|uniref:Single-stranded-DNA-specific exonuclease RecJ n=1 Tax=Tenacibaculum discolor TaxID=361581 RepID=A0A2G1BW63_9FLAO|nr:single-stranded-DNA-specific exonuclease RecJ [Tenacibaculum discolor]MDP2539855.1 single-stranded-DNA-specific exonuclease RecJ [Tenacibaculum discolor]PHN97825.1 single-stranded-DNA-specific exonuclease RecJ [Tenacibaculum discolor]PHO00138.1 single-stranded-DNA-specific exonuclease RecJ [Rhodobacteraceae bacterium 4F10]